MKRKFNWVKLWAIKRKIFNVNLGGGVEVYKFLYLLVRKCSSTIRITAILPNSYVLKRYLILRLYSQEYNVVELQI